MFLTYKIKNFFQVIVIIIIFCLGFPKFEKIIYPYYYARYLETKDYLLESHDFTYIIVGNSHATYSFAPNIFNNVTFGKNTMNLSTNGAGIPSIYFYIKNAIDKGQTPEIIFLEVYAFRYNDFDESLPMLNNYKYFDSFIDIIKYIPTNNHNLSFSYFLGNYKWQNIGEYINENISYIKDSKNIIEYEKTLSKGFLYKDELIDIQSYKDAFQMGAFPIFFINQEKIFNQIVSICNKNNIELILFRAPSINTLGLHDIYAEEIANNYKLKLIDLNINLLNDIETPEFLFHDAYINNAGMVNSHTNYNGAVYTSLKLAEELQALGYLEIDQEIYNQYWIQLQNDLNSIEVK